MLLITMISSKAILCFMNDVGFLIQWYELRMIVTYVASIQCMLLTLKMLQASRPVEDAF